MPTFSSEGAQLCAKGCSRNTWTPENENEIFHLLENLSILGANWRTDGHTS